MFWAGIEGAVSFGLHPESTIGHIQMKLNGHLGRVVDLQSMYMPEAHE